MTSWSPEGRREGGRDRGREGEGGRRDRGRQAGGEGGRDGEKF